MLPVEKTKNLDPVKHAAALLGTMTFKSPCEVIRPDLAEFPARHEDDFLPLEGALPPRDGEDRRECTVIPLFSACDQIRVGKPGYSIDFF